MGRETRLLPLPAGAPARQAPVAGPVVRQSDGSPVRRLPEAKPGWNVQPGLDFTSVEGRSQPAIWRPNRTQSRVRLDYLPKW